MNRRETIIALRARHQSFRIASDVAYPHLDVPPPAPPPRGEYDDALRLPYHVPPPDFELPWTWEIQEELPPPRDGPKLLGFFVSDIALVILAIFFVAAGILLCVYG